MKKDRLSGFPAALPIGAAAILLGALLFRLIVRESWTAGFGAWLLRLFWPLTCAGWPTTRSATAI